MSAEKSNLSVVKNYGLTLKSVRANPALYSPFIIFAIVEFISLIFVFLIPRPPLRQLIGPVISSFWGDIFLHYPTNFLLLPKLASFARMGLAIVLGSLMTGMAVDMVFCLHQKKALNLERSFNSALKKYLDLLIVIAVFTLIYYFSTRTLKDLLVGYFRGGHDKLLFLSAGAWMGWFLIVINFILAIVVQSLFVYAVPLVMIEKEKSIKALIKSVLLFKNNFFSTLMIVTVAMLVYVPVLVLTYNSSFLLDKFFPEIVLWVMVLSTLVSSLIIDPLITISITNLYLSRKKDNS